MTTFFSDKITAALRKYIILKIMATYEFLIIVFQNIR